MAAAARVPLPHERVLIQSCLGDDPLLIFSKGMSPLRFAALLLSEWWLIKQETLKKSGKSCYLPLVVCLGITEDEFTLFKKRMRQFPPLQNFQMEYLGAQSDSKHRLQILPKGGIFAASSRTFVIDTLNANLDPVILDGVLIFHAHRLITRVNEIFALTLMREGGRNSFFVKAFSDDPGEMIKSFNQAERTMRLLNSKRLLLAPRGAPKVSTFIDNPQNVGVYDHKLLPFSDNAEHIKQLLMKLIDTGLTELIGSSVDIPRLTELQTTGRETFYQDLDKRPFAEDEFLLPKLGPSGRRLLKDIQIFRSLLQQLSDHQAAAFYDNLTQMTRSTIGGIDSTWLLSSNMDELLRIAKSRVYTVDNKEGLLSIQLNLELDSRLVQLSNIIQNESSIPPHKPKRGLVVVSSGRRALEVYLTLISSPRLPALLAVRSLFQNFKSSAELNAVEVAWRKEYVNLPFRPEAQEYKSHVDLISQTNVELDILAVDDDSAGTIEDYIVSETPHFVILMDLKLPWIRETEMGCGRISMLKTILDRKERNVLQSPPSTCKTESVSDFQGRFNDAHTNDAAGRAAVKRELPSPKNGSGSARKKLKKDNLLIDQIVTSDSQPVTNHGQPVINDSVAPSSIGKMKIFILGIVDSDEEAQFNASVATELLAWNNLLHQKESLLVFENDRSLEAIGSMKTLDERLKYMLSDGVHLSSYAPSRKAGGGRAMMLKEVNLRISKRQKEHGLEERTAPLSDQDIQSMDMRDLMALLKPAVIVDVREFRSALPFQLWSSGLRLVPVTLAIGDYVLSNDTVIERKSVPDLIQSLASGRLFRQCERMIRKFKRPILLVELDSSARGVVDRAFESDTTEETNDGNRFNKRKGGKAGGGGGVSMRSSRSSLEGRTSDVHNQLITKLTVLMIHFPMLRMIWSLDAGFSSDMFWVLKEGREQPNLAAIEDNETNTTERVAMADEAKRSYRRALDSTNYPAIDLLQKVPKMSTRALDRIVRRLDNLNQLLALNDVEIYQVMGKEEGHAWLETLDDTSWKRS